MVAPVDGDEPPLSLPLGVVVGVVLGVLPSEIGPTMFESSGPS